MNDIVFGYLHCGRKVRYKSKTKAQKISDVVNKRHPNQPKMAPYHCKVCDGWHNGHPAESK